MALYQTQMIFVRFVFISPNGINTDKKCRSCKSQMYFAYPTNSKSPICDDGEIKQDDVSKYNHCITYNQCSAAYLKRDWIIKGYRLSLKLKI